MFFYVFLPSGVVVEPERTYLPHALNFKSSHINKSGEEY